MVKAKPLAKHHGAHASTHHVVANVHTNHQPANSFTTKWLALAFVVIFGGLGSFFLFFSHADSVNTLYKLTLADQGPKAVYYTTSPDTVSYNEKYGWKVAATYKFVNEAGSSPVAVYGAHQPNTNNYVFSADPSKFPADWTNVGVRFYESGSSTVPTGYCRDTSSGWKLDLPCIGTPTTQPKPVATPAPTTPAQTQPVTAPTTSRPTTSPVSVAQANHNPYGWYDFCAYTNNQTVLYGWAADPDASAGALPNVKFSLQQYVLKAGQVSTSNPVTQPANFTLKDLVSGTAPTDGANYRDTAINAYIQASHPGDPQPGTYGFRIALSGLYKGNFYYLPVGTVVNTGLGSDGQLRVNGSQFVDGDASRPYFANALIPDTCLAPVPTNSKTKELPVSVDTAPAAAPVSSSVNATPIFVGTNGSFNWEGQKGASFEDGRFKLENGNYALYLSGNKLTESFKGQVIWQDPATVSYPAGAKAKAAQLYFNARGQIQVVDPNVTTPHFAVWSSPVQPTSTSYSLQLSACGGIYMYQLHSGLYGGSQVVKTNAAQDPTCGAAVIPTGANLNGDTSLYAGMTLHSPDGSHQLTMQANGAAVVTDQAGHTVWQATGSGADRLAMSASGRLILIDDDAHKVVWDSGTAGSGGDYAALQNNGYLTIYASSEKKSTPVWENGVSAASCTAKKLVAEFPSTGGIRCVQPAPVNPGAPRTTAGASFVTRIPCTDIGSGKHECTFIAHSPVMNAQSVTVGYFSASVKNWVTCEAHSSKTVVHGSDKGVWWAHTVADNGQAGWVSSVFAKGGDDFGDFLNVPACAGSLGNPPTSLTAQAQRLPTPRSGGHGAGGSQSGAAEGGSHGSGSGSTLNGLGSTASSHNFCTHSDGWNDGCQDDCGPDGQRGLGHTSGSSDGTCYCHSNGAAYASQRKEGHACGIVLTGAGSSSGGSVLSGLGATVGTLEPQGPPFTCYVDYGHTIAKLVSKSNSDGFKDTCQRYSDGTIKDLNIGEFIN